MGQGLAGSILALSLLDRGYSVIVIDKPELSSCSKVAAGIWNPVVFKRLTKSWMVDEVLPVMMDFYRGCEVKFNTQLITERNILKFFSEQQEVDLWRKKAQDELKDYLDTEIYIAERRGCKSSSFGYSKVKRSGNLDVNTFLSQVKKMLTSQNNFREEDFYFNALSYDGKIKYKDLQSNMIIFAEGHLIKHNPLFNYVPFKPAKGEVLTIRSRHLELEKDILNKNMFVMPLGNKNFKAGATYDWNNLSDTITEKGRKELENKLGNLLTEAYQIISQEAGVRPSVIDRRPVIGRHPVHEKVYIFNGFGTKGVMLAPYFAKQLADYLQHNSSINPEVDVQRFNKFFVN